MIDRLKDFEGSLGPQAEQIRERALDAAAVARERLGQGAGKVREFTINQPTRALGIALGMGVLLGWLIKRR